MANPATVNKTLTVSMLSLAAGKVINDSAAVAAYVASQRAAALAERPSKSQTSSGQSPTKPAATSVPAPTAKDGFHIMLGAQDGARVYGQKMIELCDGKVTTDRGATDLGAIPDSLTAAIATLQSEVAALVTSLTGVGKLSF